MHVLTCSDEIEWVNMTDELQCPTPMEGATSSVMRVAKKDLAPCERSERMVGTEAPAMCTQMKTRTQGLLRETYTRVLGAN